MKKLISAFLAGTALLGCVSGCGVNPSNNNLSIASAVYPTMADYPDESSYVNGLTGVFDNDGFSAVYDKWQADKKVNFEKISNDGLNGFFGSSSRQFLSGAGTENRIYSPLNVFMALGMLAEVTDGNSRSQILGAVGATSIEELRELASDVWRSNYCNDGAVVSVLANSLWLNESFKFNDSTLDTLAQRYYASSFAGEMGSEELNSAARSWLNEQTGGLLEEQAQSLEFTPETIMALATTIYYRAKWVNEFYADSNTNGTFHGASGDTDCEFMNMEATNTYYCSENFAAVKQTLLGSGGMWFFLPDEGVSIDTLVADENVLALTRAAEWENSKLLKVNLSVPKFDVMSDIELKDGLKALGITDVFDMTASDFSPMTSDTEKIELSQADHAARVKIDEEGVTAAAYTKMMLCGAAMPPDERVDFILDRPFLFVITSANNMPLFMGVVNMV